MSIYNYEIRSMIGTREFQQDKYVVQQKGHCLFAAVCDGMGGSMYGGEAAELCVQLFQQAFMRDRVEDIPSFFLNNIELINLRVYNRFNLIGSYSGTTLVCCVIREDELYWLSIGDSRMYVINSHGLMQLTVDHNYSNILEKRFLEKKITKEKFRDEIKRGHALTSFIGQNKLSEICMNIRPFMLSSDDTVVLASDGLYKTVSEEEMIDCNSDSVIETVERIEKCILRKNIHDKDNTTFIVIRKDGN